MMDETKNKRKQIDLNELIEGVSTWQKQIYNTYRENMQSEQEITSLKNEIAELKEVEKLKSLEIQESNNRVSELHAILSKRVSIEDENRKLRGDCDIIQEKMVTVEQAHRVELKAAQDQMEELREVLKVEIEDAVEEVRQTAKEQQGALERTISEKNSQIESLQEQLKQADKDKQADIMRIRFEYDTKMLKLQKDSARKQQLPPSSNLNQDIFRKKLQHAKAESERESAAHRKTIAELEQKITSMTEGQNCPAPGNMAKRIRRF